MQLPDFLSFNHRNNKEVHWCKDRWIDEFPALSELVWPRCQIYTIVFLLLVLLSVYISTFPHYTSLYCLEISLGIAKHREMFFGKLKRKGIRVSANHFFFYVEKTLSKDKVRLLISPSAFDINQWYKKMFANRNSIWIRYYWCRYETVVSLSICLILNIIY